MWATAPGELDDYDLEYLYSMIFCQDVELIEWGKENKP